MRYGQWIINAALSVPPRKAAAHLSLVRVPMALQKKNCSGLLQCLFPCRGVFVESGHTGAVRICACDTLPARICTGPAEKSSGLLCPSSSAAR